MTTIHANNERAQGINPKACYWKLRRKRIKNDRARQMCTILPAMRGEITYWMSKGCKVFRHSDTFFISLGVNDEGQHSVLEADPYDVRGLMEDGVVELQGMALRFSQRIRERLGEDLAA